MGFEFRVWPATTSFIYCPMLSKPIPACISCDPYISCDGAKKNISCDGRNVSCDGRNVFSTFDLQKGQALPGPPKKGLRQVCHYPN